MLFVSCAVAAVVVAVMAVAVAELGTINETKIVVVVIDISRYNPLLTYNPILQPTTYLSTVVGTF